MNWLNRVYSILMLLILASCSDPETKGLATISNNNAIELLTPVIHTPTPYLPKIEPTLEKLEIKLYVPEEFNFGVNSFSKLNFINIIDSQESADCYINPTEKDKSSGDYILSLSAPFNTITDGLSLKDLESIFSGQPSQEYSKVRILITENDLRMINGLYEVNLIQFSIVNPEDMLEIAYENQDYWALMPFDRLVPAWKVLEIENVSPYDQDFNPDDFALSIPIGVFCNSQNFQVQIDQEELPYFINRDPNKFTSVLLTGTTALTRATGARMELYGNSYPGEAIKQWFMDADISHISNEVSFTDTCPNANPNQKDLFFCSRPEYADLFDYLNIDVIELTGNHLVDKGTQPLNDTFKLLKAKSIPYYAAGLTIDEAEMPVKFELNGNRIAFLGCNEAGPNFVWIAEGRSGLFRCDFDRMAELIVELRSQDYLPIVTYQYWETAQFKPMPYQRDDSIKMIEAGAVVVSGSQSHLPMSMEVYKKGFIHYGLGNLFFDQMDIPFKGTRREFLDRHIFYDGKYLGVQLYTAMLEDYAQPRPMTKVERDSLLRDAFSDFKIVLD